MKMSDSYPVVKGKRPKASSKANRSFVSNVTSRVSGFLPSTITKWFSPSSSANGSATLAESTDSSTEDEATESPITTQPAAKRMRFSSPAKNANTHYTPISTRTSSTNTEAMEPFITAASTSDIMFRRATNLVSPHVQQNDESIVSANDSKINNFDLYSTPEVSLERKRKSIFDKTQDSDAIIEDAVARSASAKVVNLTQPYFKAGLLCSPFYSGRTSYGGAAGSYINQPNINKRRKTVVKENNTNDNVTISNSARRIMDILENYSSPLKEAKRIPQYSGPNTSLYLKTTDSSSKIKNTSYKTQELHVPQIASIIRLKQKRLMDTTNAARQIIASLSSSTPYPQSMTSQSVPEKEKLTTKIKSRLTRTNRDPLENSMAPPPVNLPTISLQIENDNLPKFSFNTTSAITLTSSPITLTNSLAISTNIAPNIPETQIGGTNKAKDATMSLLNQKTTLHEGKKNPTVNNSISHFKLSSPVKVSIEQSTGSATKFLFRSPERNLDSANGTTGFTFSQTESQPKTVGNTNIPNIPDTVNMKNNPNKGCSCNSGFGDKSKCVVCEKKTNSIDKLPITNASASDKWKCTDCWVLNDSSSVACVCCRAKKSGETPNQSIAADSSKATKSDKWKCKDCWVDNENIASKCVCCGANKTGGKSTPVSKPAQTDKWKCKDCWVENDSSVQKCVCCGGNKSSEKPNQSVKPAQTDKWKCKDCWVENDSSASKCVCCGCLKTVISTSEKQKTNSLVATSKEKSNDSDWKCDVCWIKNKSSADKCVACSNPKPGSKSVAGGATNLPLQNTTQSQSDKWECSICLVRNENNRIKCVCCEAEKPGAKKQPESKFSFKDNPGALFKFGIPPGAKQDTNVQVPSLVKETPAKESEANNNILPKATFTFGIPMSNQETAKPVEESKKDEPAKPTFSFGINKPIPTSTSVEVPKPLLGMPNKPEVIETTSTVSDKTVEAPKTQPAIPVLTSTPSISIASNLFAPPTTSTTLSENKTSTPSLSFLNSPATTISVASSNVLSTSMSTATATSTETKAPTSTFSFSAGTIKPSVNLFASPISQVTTASSTFPSVTAAVTTSISLFSKSEPVNTAPISLFQKSDTAPVYLPVFGGNTTTTTTTVSQLPTTSGAPVFRFSNISNNAASNNEKPKFNFRFAKNNSNNEIPSMFKSFGATSESNKFTLPTSNTLGLNSITGNTIGGSGLSTGINSSNNALPGINGLPTGNAILGGDIGSNQPNTGNTLSSGSTSSTPATGLFGNSMPKVNNMWSTNNNAASTPTQYEKPAATFTFGSSTQFNSNASNTFGAPQQPQQPTPNLFGVSNQSTNNSQPALFSNTIQTPPQSNIFGSPAASNMPMFGSPNIGSTPTFGTSTSLPTFEALSATPTPSFNFGSNATSGVFGFSQQQQPQQQQQQQTGGVYNFVAGGAAPQVQFNMGSAPNTTAARRVRKAIRRTQR